jgi:hypothetical protein
VCDMQLPNAYYYLETSHFRRGSNKLTGGGYSGRVTHMSCRHQPCLLRNSLSRSGLSSQKESTPQEGLLQADQTGAEKDVRVHSQQCISRLTSALSTATALLQVAFHRQRKEHLKKDCRKQTTLVEGRRGVRDALPAAEQAELCGPLLATNLVNVSQLGASELSGKHLTSACHNFGWLMDWLDALSVSTYSPYASYPFMPYVEIPTCRDRTAGSATQTCTRHKHHNQMRTRYGT